MINQDNNDLNLGISLTLLFDSKRKSFVLGAKLIFPDGKKFMARKHFESPLNECISCPVISRVGLRKFIWLISQDIKKAFGNNVGIVNLDYDRIYNYIETARINSLVNMRVPIDDEEQDNGYDE